MIDVVIIDVMCFIQKAEIGLELRRAERGPLRDPGVMPMYHISRYHPRMIGEL